MLHLSVCACLILIKCACNHLQVSITQPLFINNNILVIWSGFIRWCFSSNLLVDTCENIHVFADEIARIENLRKTRKNVTLFTDPATTFAVFLLVIRDNVISAIKCIFERREKDKKKRKITIFLVTFLLFFILFF